MKIKTFVGRVGYNSSTPEAYAALDEEVNNFIENVRVYSIRDHVVVDDLVKSCAILARVVLYDIPSEVNEDDKIINIDENNP